jgi:arylsulfatase A-like enzyme
MKTVDALNPDQPFFVYYAPGATHAPHHPTPEWIDKISEMHLFDEGWNALRETIFANQKKLGVIPEDAQLTPWPEDLIKQWDSSRHGEEAVHQAGRCLCRLCSLHRPRDRPRDPGGRGSGPARQHPDHLHHR